MPRGKKELAEQIIPKLRVRITNWYLLQGLILGLMTGALFAPPTPGMQEAFTIGAGVVGAAIGAVAAAIFRS